MGDVIVGSIAHPCLRLSCAPLSIGTFVARSHRKRQTVAPGSSWSTLPCALGLALGPRGEQCSGTKFAQAGRGSSKLCLAGCVVFGARPRIGRFVRATPSRKIEVVSNGIAVAPPDDLQRQVTQPVCFSRYPFPDLVRRVLQEPPTSDLEKLHKTIVGKRVLELFRKRATHPHAALGPRGTPWNQRYLSCPARSPETFREFLAVYRDFVRCHLLDALGTERLAFQERPTFRCHLPGCGASGRPHRDEDYKHPPCEINFWIPLTPAYASNSLYAESRRGAGDFRPFDVRAGEVVRFYGSQVWHYTVPNETDTTRVSLDVRVIREQEWSPAAFSWHKLGGHYSVMTREGVISRESPEMMELQSQYLCPPGRKKRLSEEQFPSLVA